MKDVSSANKGFLMIDDARTGMFDEFENLKRAPIDSGRLSP
jgi:hypothetical protein